MPIIDPQRRRRRTGRTIRDVVRLDVRKGSPLEDLNRLKAQTKRPGTRPRMKRPPVWLYPAGAELEYERYLLALVRHIENLTRQIIIPLLPAWAAEARQDSARVDLWPDDVRAAVEQLRLRFGRDPGPQPGEVSRTISREVAEQNQRQWIKVARATLGINVAGFDPDLGNVLEAFGTQNETWDIPARLFNQVQETVTRGLSEGKRHEAIAKELLGRGIPRGVFHKARTRARLIARDQVGKLNGEITKRRQQALGVTSYIWRTAQDNRVRPAHREREGKEFAWNNPPSDGHPGQAINCRCYAEPVLGPEFDSLEVQTARKGTR